MLVNASLTRISVKVGLGLASKDLCYSLIRDSVPNVMSHTRDFLSDREAVLLDLLDEMRARMEPLENELADVRRARAALGPEPATLLDVARRLAIGPPGADPSNFA